ncbi:hypothetical protein LP419_21515 [Massilia sp. H-1]|nr:hypothetical protein LP419_21515 [Massilia sp. H-1]
MVVKAVVKNGGAVLQKTFNLSLSEEGAAAYDYVFPASIVWLQGLSTRVLQTKTGKVYTCKPFPYSGWCTQWSATATTLRAGRGGQLAGCVDHALRIVEQK